MQWCTPVTRHSGRVKQKDRKLEPSLGKLRLLAIPCLKIKNRHKRAEDIALCEAQVQGLIPRGGEEKALSINWAGLYGINKFRKQS